MTPHFTLAELTHSDTAVRFNINNTPSYEITQNLLVAASGLELVRALLGGPVRINSGYRCAALNKRVGGSASSAHMQGFAVDFTCTGFGTPLQIVKAIEASDIKYDQVIAEGTWVHISFDPKLRGQVMTAHFDGTGKPTYTQGA